MIVNDSSPILSWHTRNPLSSHDTFNCLSHRQQQLAKHQVRALFASLATSIINFVSGHSLPLVSDGQARTPRTSFVNHSDAKMVHMSRNLHHLD